MRLVLLLQVPNLLRNLLRNLPQNPRLSLVRVLPAHPQSRLKFGERLHLTKREPERVVYAKTNVQVTEYVLLIAIARALRV